MAQINFPEPQANGEVFNKDGVLYQYSGNPGSGFWKANSANVVDDAYINTSGDVMTGDLTLSDLSGLGDAVLGVNENGKLVRGNALSTFTSPFVTRTGDNITGNLVLENNLGDPRISLDHQTGNVFALGDLEIGSFNVDEPLESALSRNGGGIAAGKLFAKRNDSNDNQIFEGYNIQGNITSKIYGNGSAQFSDVRIESGSVISPLIKAGGQELANHASTSEIYSISSKNSQDNTVLGVTAVGELHIGGSLDTNVSSPLIALYPDGSANFAESITVGSVASTGNVSIGGDLDIGTYSIKNNGDSSFAKVNTSEITSTTSSLGNVTCESLAINSSFTITSGGSFGSDVDISGNLDVTGILSCGSASFTGAISATDYGAVNGTTAVFTSSLAADSASITGSVSANDLNINGSCTTGSIVGSGSIDIATTGLFGSTISCSGVLSSTTVDISVDLPSTNALTISQASNENALIRGDGSAQFASNNMMISSNGNVLNINNSYSGISDKKFKTNIQKASSQWQDIKNINLVNYQFKPTLGFGTDKHLGVISQEIKTFCPSLVEIKDDYKKVSTLEFDDFGMPVLDEYGNQKSTDVMQKTGTKTESVKYSVLYLKALGALQEAMQRIETLEAQVKALNDK